MKIEEVREVMKKRYHDADDDEIALQYSGFVHEHPLIAIGTVLVSSVVLGTIDVTRLAEFTEYSRAFVAAIATNMENSSLWKDGKYQALWTANGNLLPRNKREDCQLWRDIEVAEGNSISPDAKSDTCENPCKIFWPSSGRWCIDEQKCKAKRDRRHPANHCSESEVDMQIHT